jgi:hypothetical protein
MNKSTGAIVQFMSSNAAPPSDEYVTLTEFEVRALNRLPASARPGALASLRMSGNRKQRRAAAALLRRRQ